MVNSAPYPDVPCGPPNTIPAMSRNGKVIVAMSGGVDSSVAACLLREQGYECIGVFMRAGAAPPEPRACAADGGASTGSSRRAFRHGCCSADDAADARAVAGRLGIPFYALNFEAEFGAIINYFVDEYARGRTPNPCVQCNIRLKFGRLLEYANLLDAPFVATGHYARIVQLADPQGRPAHRLARAANLDKDQSYVLFGIQAADLPRCRFPLGEFRDKREVRAVAAELGLRVHDKPDSQEVCFVPDHDYKRLVHERRPQTVRVGELRDRDGRRIGTHDGVASFTIGQRRGLGVALGVPAYVTRLDVLNNVVTLGSRDDLLADGLVAEDLNWHGDAPPVLSAEADAAGSPVEIKIRHAHEPAAGHLRRLEDGSAEARFVTRQSAVTPGQAAVFYDPAGVVLGGGWIRSAIPLQPTAGAQ